MMLFISIDCLKVLRSYEMLRLYSYLYETAKSRPRRVSNYVGGSDVTSVSWRHAGSGCQKRCVYNFSHGLCAVGCA